MTGLPGMALFIQGMHRRSLHMHNNVRTKKPARLDWFAWCQ